MHKIIKALLVIFIFCTSSIVNAEVAEKKTLRIAVTYFTPPFINHTGGGNYMGFDVNMLAYICYYMQRECQYEAMRFAELIPSLKSNKFDIASSGMIITPERALQVSMSTPYLISASRFVTHIDNKEERITKKVLQNKKIGVEKGSVFGNQLKTWGISGIKIVEFDNESDEVLMLSQAKLDYILMDNYTAIYWNNTVNNKLRLVGKPIKYGYGYGVAVNPNDSTLLQEVNRAINAYVRSPQYKENYNLYFTEFKK